MAASVESVRAGLEPLIVAAGLDLEELQIQQAGRREIVRVVIDRDGGINIDLVADVSREISEALEAEPLNSQFAGTYVLEVSSPGIDRPLTEVKHWRRAHDRLVEVQLRDGSQIVGRITAISDEELTLEVVDGKTTASQTISLSLVELGRVQVEFNRVTTEGAEDGH
ncbi:MAG: ribosome maturation factor RimP [Actinomycetota bacterium]|nr:ribosome maturation factor RimP [Actinomycetota bacterium]